jgi:hypothetical protein
MVDPCDIFNFILFFDPSCLPGSETLTDTRYRSSSSLRNAITEMIFVYVLVAERKIGWDRKSVMFVPPLNFFL